MNKLSSWHENLMSYIESLRFQTFEYGKSDCWLFASKCVDLQYGTNFSNEFKYTTPKQAMKLLKQHGGLPKVYSERLFEKDPNYIQRGDIVVYMDAHGETSGVYLSGLVWALGNQGIVANKLNLIEIVGVWGEPRCQPQ